jgi:AcrR family transcriptional regulator
MAEADPPRRRRASDPTGEPEGLRERKKRATRQFISNVATKLFTERGFDNVTVDEVAAAANVSKMTVFNYFPRKEDLFFDRSDEAQQFLRVALEGRGRRSPLAALRALAYELLEQRHPFVKVTASVAAFWKVVAASPTLRAHTRELGEEVERDLGQMLASSVGAPPGDPTARLIAALLMGAWRVAYREALRRHRSARAANREGFIELLERGFVAASAAARGSPYVGARPSERTLRQGRAKTYGSVRPRQQGTSAARGLTRWVGRPDTTKCLGCSTLSFAKTRVESARITGRRAWGCCESLAFNLLKCETSTRLASS